MKETMYSPEHGKIVVSYYSSPPVWVFWLLYATLLLVFFAYLINRYKHNKIQRSTIVRFAVYFIIYTILGYLVNSWIPSIDSSIYIVFLLSLNYVVIKWIKDKDEISQEKDE